MCWRTKAILVKLSCTARSASSRQHGIQCSWWSVTSKQNNLKQPRGITTTDLDFQHQQNPWCGSLWNTSGRREVWAYQTCSPGRCVAGTCITDASEGLSPSWCKSLQNLHCCSCCKAVKTLQLLQCSVYVITRLWKMTSVITSSDCLQSWRITLAC
jgi:hypothetical protein